MGQQTFTESFTAVGNGAETVVKNCDRVNYSVSGTFVGTVEFQKSHNGRQSWETVATTSVALGATEYINNKGSDAYVRFVCTAFTSGTIVAVMVEQAKTIQIFKNKITGETIMELTEAGVNIPGALVAGSQSYANLIAQVADDEFVELSGGNAADTGGNLKAYGSTHATQAGDWELRDDTTPTLSYDKSADSGAGALTSAHKMLFPDGTAALPAISFVNAPDDGFFWNGGALRIAMNGAEVAQFSGLTFRMQNAAGTQVLAGDGTNLLPGFAFSGDLDTGIYRQGNDVLRIATGGAPGIIIDAGQQVTIPGALDHNGTTAGFLSATPVAQQSAIANSSGTDAVRIDAIRDVLNAFGFIA